MKSDDGAAPVMTMLVGMNQMLMLVLVAASMACSFSCSKASAEAEPRIATTQGSGRTLIVYLSRTQNTKTLAELIQQQVGGDLLAVELVTPYPTDYKANVNQVDRENDEGYLPPLKTRIANLKDYDIVFVGFPTWDMQLPPPMKSFLRTHDLSGKTVIPFNTNGGYGKGSSFDAVRELCPDSKVLQGLSIDGGREREGILLALKGERFEEVRAQVAQWLRDIRVLNHEATP